MFDEGSGPALVVVPGVQGRWEWFEPALVELSRRCRTISYSLCGDYGSGMRYDPAIGFDNYVRQLDSVLDRCGVDRATLCGVSYGGFIALRYAARRSDRVAALVLASSPAPGWTPTEQQRRYVEHPWRAAPRFVLTSPLRLLPEIRAAYDSWPERIRFSVAHAARALRYPMRPPLMAGRITLQQSVDFGPDCAAVRVRTLVVSGEDALDRIVPAAVTRRYGSLIPGARLVTLERTGHLGLVTRPRQFAGIVGGFVVNATSH